MKQTPKWPLEWLASVHLDRNDPLPLFEQLYLALRDLILTRRLAAHARLPSTRSLAEGLSLSRNTVITAYQKLESEGFLYAKSGSGYRVAALLPDAFLTPDTDIRPAPEVEIGSDFDPEMRPFAPGQPDLQAFPVEAWARISARIWRSAGRRFLTYGDPLGFLPLRLAISDYLGTCRGLSCSPEQVLIVQGGQQALDLVARVLVSKGDRVFLENPCYQGAFKVFDHAGADLVSCSVDDQGMCVPEEMDQGESARLVFMTPSHQYPSGITMSLQRRLHWLRWTAERGAWLLEDDYDSEFRYQGRPLPALCGLSGQDRLLYMGTFSKVLFPSIRLAYLVLPPGWSGAFARLRRTMDGHPATAPQAVLAEFMNDGSFASHLRKMRRLYLKRRDFLLARLAEAGLTNYLSGEVEGGMHLTLNIPGLDDKAIRDRAAERGYVVRALSDYDFQGQGLRGLILGYAGFETERLQEAWDHLLPLLEKAMKNPEPEARG